MANSKSEIEAKKLRKRELAQTASRLAKTANTRLRALEKKGLQNGSNAYRYIEKIHFDKDNATATDSQGRMKFNTNFRGLSYQEIQHRIGEINNFLKAQTSTVSGVKSAYQKGYETYKANAKNEAPNISFSDFADIMRNQKIKDSKKMFGSKLAVRIIKHISETGETVKQALERIKDFDMQSKDMYDLEDDLTKEMPWQESNEEREETENITDWRSIT